MEALHVLSPGGYTKDSTDIPENQKTWTNRLPCIENWLANTKITAWQMMRSIWWG